MKSSKLDLYKNTIGDFHRNLMDYYHLAGERHSSHSGEYVRYVGNFPVPEFDVSDLNLKDRTILRARDWGSKEDWRDYMMAKGYNKSNTKLDMVESEDLPSDMHRVLKQFEINLRIRRSDGLTFTNPPSITKTSTSVYEVEGCF